jgi:DNA polymerase-4
MHSLGIVTGADLGQHSEEFLRQHFGKAGSYFYNLARGIDDRPVVPDRNRKSVGAEETYEVDLIETEDAEAALAKVIDKTWARCQRNDTRGRTVTLKVKYADFEQITRSRSLGDYVSDVAVIRQTSLDLLRALYPLPRGIRLLGVTISGLESDVDAVGDDGSPQLSLLL